jgi:sugar (pentulose or hexulose) kinase
MEDLSKPGSLVFCRRDLAPYPTYEEAYHQLFFDLVSQQLISTRLVINKNNRIMRIFVDGGFSNNPVFMNVFASAFPDKEIFAASVPQASALGAALAIHPYWNKQAAPKDIIKLKRYAAGQRS